MLKIKVIIGVLLILMVGFILFMRMTHREDETLAVNLEVTSEAFGNDGLIPTKYTGKGEDLSPPLKFGEIDVEAKTIAVIMDDLDHPLGLYNHWVIWNIPASVNSLPEGIPRTEVVPSLGNAIQGKSAYGGKHYYRGPLPPFGTHAYIFRVYVLDCELDLEKNANKAALKEAMNGHVLQYGTLTGKYRSGGNEE